MNLRAVAKSRQQWNNTNSPSMHLENEINGFSFLGCLDIIEVYFPMNCLLQKYQDSRILSWNKSVVFYLHSGIWIYGKKEADYKVNFPLKILTISYLLHWLLNIKLEKHSQHVNESRAYYDSTTELNIVR